MMRGTKAKALRRQARVQCDPAILKMRVARFRIASQPIIGQNGEQLVDPKGDPMVIPEHFRYTAFWPMTAYRRVLKHLKRGYVTGVRYVGKDNSNG